MDLEFHSAPLVPIPAMVIDRLDHEFLLVILSHNHSGCPGSTVERSQVMNMSDCVEGVIFLHHLVRPSIPGRSLPLLPIGIYPGTLLQQGRIRLG